MSDSNTRSMFYMYRLRDAHYALLYVGITSQSPPTRRFAQHAKDKHWWPSVAHWNLEPLYTYNRREAEEIERGTIILERPKWNVAHNNDKYLFGVAGHCFICSVCESAAATVQYDNPLWDGWSALCPQCGDVCDDDGELFSIQARLIGTSEQLSAAVEHLSPKAWFDFDKFMAFVAQQHLAVAA